VSWRKVVLMSLIAALGGVMPERAAAQQPPSMAAPADSPARSSRAWLAAGGTWTSLLGDCTDCAADTYLHNGGVMAGAGVSSIFGPISVRKCSGCRRR
jgi:hypothetical protein